MKRYKRKKSYYRKGKPVKAHRQRYNYSSKISMGFPGGKSRQESKFRSKEPWTETRQQLFELTSPKNPRYGSKITFWGTGKSIAEEQQEAGRKAEMGFRRIKPEKIPAKQRLTEEQEYYIEAHNIAKKQGDKEAMEFLRKQGKSFGLDL